MRPTLPAHDVVELLYERWNGGMPFSICMHILDMLGPALPMPLAKHENIDTWIRYRYCSHCGEPINRVMYSRIRTWLRNAVSENRYSTHATCRFYRSALRRRDPRFKARARAPLLERLYLVPYYGMRMFGLQHRLWWNSVSVAVYEDLLGDSDTESEEEDHDEENAGIEISFPPLSWHTKPPTPSAPRPCYVVYTHQKPHVFSFSTSTVVPGSVIVTKRRNVMTFSALHNTSLWTVQGFEQMMRHRIRGFALPENPELWEEEPMRFSDLQNAWVRAVNHAIFRTAPDLYCALPDKQSEPEIPFPLCHHPNQIYELAMRSARLRDIFMGLGVSHTFFPLRYECCEECDNDSAED